MENQKIIFKIMTKTFSDPSQEVSRSISIYKKRQALLEPARRRNNCDDFVTYPEALSNCISVWTLTWVNQKGYVTGSYNVTHDGKITTTILLPIPRLSATVLVHGLQPG